jgi:hypothetical protein
VLPLRELPVCELPARELSRVPLRAPGVPSRAAPRGEPVRPGGYMLSAASSERWRLDGQDGRLPPVLSVRPWQLHVLSLERPLQSAKSKGLVAAGVALRARRLWPPRSRCVGGSMLRRRWSPLSRCGSARRSARPARARGLRLRLSYS